MSDCDVSKAECAGDYEEDALNDKLNCLESFVLAVSPFLRRLQEPRFDKHETNDYICNSSDCKKALEAMAEYDASWYQG